MDNNYISTKKKRVKYQFVTRDTENNQNKQSSQNDDLIFYYQICTFQEPKNNKYQMRKFVINSRNEFLAINDFYLTKKQCKKFYKYKKQHEYKCFPMYNLNGVDYPTLADIITAKSDILSTDYNYSGFAPF